MACAAKERTALEKHSQQMKHMEDAAVMLYPMYTVPLEALLLMTAVRPHQELLEDQATFIVDVSNDNVDVEARLAECRMGIWLRTAPIPRKPITYAED